MGYLLCPSQLKVICLSIYRDWTYAIKLGRDSYSDDISVCGVSPSRAGKGHEDSQKPASASLNDLWLRKKERLC